MLDPVVVARLKDRYSHLPPLLVHRSVERAGSNGELFDILDTVPAYPVVWDDDSRRWVTAADPYLAADFKPPKPNVAV